MTRNTALKTTGNVSSKWSIEPEITIPAPHFGEKCYAMLPGPLHGVMGSWDVSALLTPEPVTASPAPPKFTTEQAVAFLSNLPKGLSSHEQHLRTKEFLAKVTQDGGALASELVGDAAQQIVTIRESLRRLEQHYQLEQSDDEICIQVLEERLARLRNQMQQRQARTDEERQSLRTQLDEMMGVIVFFDGYQGFLRQKTESGTNVKEVPSHLCEDSVRRLVRQSGHLAFG